jgi:hypothetical protein
MTRPALASTAIPIAEGLGSVLHRAAGILRPRRVETCTATERVVFAAEVALGVLGELRQAYAEQTSPLLRTYGCAPNYRLALDDLLFAQRWVAWLTYKADLALWHEIPENRAAAASEAACVFAEEIVALPVEVKDRLGQRPHKPPECTLANAPHGWPPTLRDWSWSLTFEWLLDARRVQAGARLFREPGDDDDLDPAEANR